MKNVRKLSATIILTLVFACSAFAGDISCGVAAPTPGDISCGVAGDISCGIVQALAVVVSTVIP